VFPRTPSQELPAFALTYYFPGGKIIGQTSVKSFLEGSGEPFFKKGSPDITALKEHWYYLFEIEFP